MTDENENGFTERSSGIFSFPKWLLLRGLNGVERDAIWQLSHTIGA